MLAEFQRGCDLPVPEQSKAHSRAQRQNAFKTSPGDHPKALDAGIIKHANRLAQILCHDRVKPEAMPLFGTEIGRKTESACTTPGKPIETRSKPL